jgi:arginine deiminase
MNINVASETDHLKGVIVHTPGREVTLVTPDFKDELLFDDIIFESDAREEHQDMLEVFKVAMGNDGSVIEICDLIGEVFEQKEAREYFITEMIDELQSTNIRSVKNELHQLTPKQLLEFAIEGQTKALPDFSLYPSPNILFTRDLAAVINNGIIISRAAKEARIRESMLMDTLVEFHPLFDSVRENKFKLEQYDSIEGGDILIPSPDLALVGMSERTSFSGIMKAAEAFFSFGIKNVLIVDIPKQRSSMHLDTIFTFASPTECIVYPPAITARRDNVVCLSQGESGKLVTELKPSLKKALEELMGHEMTFIECGGEDPVFQSREQWTDGANVFALAPGVIVGYERNTNTFNALKEHGYEILNQYEFIDRFKDGSFDPNSGEKLAISFVGNELCRGRGGARCMTMPISRNRHFGKL